MVKQRNKIVVRSTTAADTIVGLAQASASVPKQSRKRRDIASDTQDSEPSQSEGEIGDIHDLDEDAEVWSELSADNCLSASENDPQEMRQKKLQEMYLAPVDSEDDNFETPATTIGRVPVEWYDDFPHIGYDLDGKRVMKPATKDELDSFLAKMDDPKYWSTFHDPTVHKDVALSTEELEIIKKLQQGSFPHADYDPYPDFDEPFVSQVMDMPLTAAPEPKSRFIRSKWEHNRIMKIVRAIRKGLIVGKKPKVNQREQFFDLWNDTEDPDQARKNNNHIAAPKLKLPEHEESYNPPEEYLPTQEEIDEWKAMDHEDRPRSYLTTKFPNLRSVPGFPGFMNERFARCLDLYLCPRAMRKRVVDSESLMPKLPDPKELEPYPKNLAIDYVGHSDRVRSFSFDPSGQWMVSGSDDCTVRLWEVETGRCLNTWTVSDPVLSVAWNPSKNLCIFAFAAGNDVILVNPAVGNRAVAEATDLLLSADISEADPAAKTAKWKKSAASDYENGFRVIISHTKEVSQIVWHRKGDYLSSVASDAGAQAVQIHQLSKLMSQCPFSKSNGLVQCVIFHPSKPYFYVATQKYVRIYNLLRQELIKKLEPNVKWISSMDIHPQGDNLLVGSYDKKVCWFDMDLSVQPYKTMRNHEFAVRNVAFHKRFPLFSSCSDDGNVQIFHGMVYGDLSQNPLIVPVKIIEAHKKVAGGLGSLCCQFHPTQPWLATSGADGTIKLFS